MFAHESFVLAGFLKISKHNVWVSQSILLQLLPMRTQNSNRLLYGKVGHSTVLTLHESFVLAGFLKISKHNVWVSQSILLQLLPMRTQNSNRLLYGKVGHSTVLTLPHAHIFKLTKRSILNTTRV